MQTPNETKQALVVNDTEKLLTVNEVAKILDISPAWVRAHSNGSRQPQIPAVRMGTCVRFRRGTVEKFIADMERLVSIWISRNPSPDSVLLRRRATSAGGLQASGICRWTA